MKLDKIQAIIGIISFITTVIYSMIKFLTNQFNQKLDSLRDEILLATKDSMNRFIIKNEESRAILFEKINSNLNRINNEINLIKNNYDHQNILIDTKIAAMNQIFLEQIANLKSQLHKLETSHTHFSNSEGLSSVVEMPNSEVGTQKSELQKLDNLEQ